MDENSQLLVKRSKSGDAEAFGELYALIWKDLYRFAFYTLGKKEEAEDAVQQSAAEAFHSMGSLRDAAAFKQWMFTILARCCKRRLKAIIRDKNNFSLDELDAGGIVIESGSDQDEKISLMNALQTLNPQERVAVMLSVVGGYKSSELSSVLKRPDATIRSQLHRGLMKLKKQLSESE